MSTVNGVPVTVRGTWLDTCRAAGVDVPTLCHDGRVRPGGHCRACLIEVDGRFVPACSTPAHAGQAARTDTEALRAYRRDLGELMLSESRPAGRAGATIAQWGADGSRYGLAAASDRRDASHALLRFEADRCILCRICLRVCEEVEGNFVFAIEGRGADSRLGWGGGELAATDCTACGACIPACPSGALGAAERALPRE